MGLLGAYINNNQAFYRLKEQGKDIDNPDQRIGQDVGAFTGCVIGLITNLAQALLVIITMSFILYEMSSALFWYMIIGSLAMTIVSFVCFGAPLMRIQRVALAREATLRFSLVRIRENAESIAFYQGAPFEKMRCMEFFTKVLHIQYRHLAVFMAFHGFQSAVFMAFPFLPPLIMAPLYFDDKISFGDIQKANMLFSMLMHSMTSVAAQLEPISNLGAQAVRVSQLQERLVSMDKLKQDGLDTDSEESDASDNEDLRAIELREMVEVAQSPPLGGNRDCLRLSNVTLQPPNSSTALITDLSFVLSEGQSLMIKGPSGIGKSSLLRAIAGLWARGFGSIERCHISECFFAPQSPYLCVGTLRENALYPRNKSVGIISEEDTRVRDALNKANIGYIVDRHGLDTEVSWDEVLSGGEKQRLSFARLLLRTGVRFAILDEATSAMDPENELQAYELLRAHVPCFASVGHRPSLENFHTHKLSLEPTKGGGAIGVLSPPL